MARVKIEYFLPLIVVLIFGVLIGCLELGIRVLKPNLIFKSQANEFDIFCVSDSRLGRWHRKNFSHDFEGTKVAHNKKGIRDKDVPYERNKNRKRLLILGDSVTWGYLVNDGEQFSDLVEEKFVNTDVINMSVSGYGTGEELLLLKYEGLRYHPDIVVLFFYIGNEVTNNLEADSFETYPANIFYLENDALKISPFKLKLSQRVGVWLNENSYIVGFLRKVSKILANRNSQAKNNNKLKAKKEMNWVERLNRQHLDSLNIDYAPYQNLTYLRMEDSVPQSYFDEAYEDRMLGPSPRNYYGVELTKKLILEIKKMVEGSNSQFLFVLSPFKAQLNTADHYYRYPLRKELLRFVAEQGIDVVDLLPRFTEKKLNADDIYLPDDQAHFSVKGHQEIADILYEELTARYGNNLLNEDAKR